MATRNNKTEKISYQSGRTKIIAENPGRETFRIILLEKIFKVVYIVLTMVSIYLLADKAEALPKSLPSVLKHVVSSG